MTIATPAVVGARFRAARERQKMSAAQVTIRAGLTDSKMVLRLESAERQPGVFTVARIAAALGESLDDLLAPPDSARAVCPHCGRPSGAP